jgi:Fe-S oxidoreductase
MTIKIFKKDMDRGKRVDRLVTSKPNTYTMIKKYYLECFGERIPLTRLHGESIQEMLMKDFGWLLKPIMEQTNGFEKALDKLNWKVIETTK